MARPGTFQKGNKLGQGRPPLEKSLTKALRDKTDPQKAAEGILELTKSKDEAIRMRAWSYIYDRLDGTPLQSLRTQSEDLPQIVIAGPGQGEGA